MKDSKVRSTFTRLMPNVLVRKPKWRRTPNSCSIWTSPLRCSLQPNKQLFSYYRNHGLRLSSGWKSISVLLIPQPPRSHGRCQTSNLDSRTSKEAPASQVLTLFPYLETAAPSLILFILRYRHPSRGASVESRPSWTCEHRHVFSAHGQTTIH